MADGDGRELTSTFCFDADPLSPNVLPLVPAVDALAIRRTDLLHATAQDDLMSLSLLEDLFSGVCAPNTSITQRRVVWWAMAVRFDHVCFGSARNWS